MAPSPRKNNVSAAAVLLLLVIVTAGTYTCTSFLITFFLLAAYSINDVVHARNAEMVPAAGSDACSCRHLSSTYFGVCLNSNGCDQTCKNEGGNNYRGACDDFPPRCYCYSQCAPP